jgi:hypothetical protein
LRSSKSQLVSFQAIPHSFTKTPGGGRGHCFLRAPRGEGGTSVSLGNCFLSVAVLASSHKKRNGTDIDVCPTNREWCCARQRRLNWKRDFQNLVGQVIYG